MELPRVMVDLYTWPVLLIILPSGPSSSLTITETAKGCHHVLTCQNTTDNDTVLWFRNNLEIIQTSKDWNGSSMSFPDLHDDATLVDVDVSDDRHSLTMKVYLHNGEISWRCETASEVSNNLTLNATSLSKDSGIPYNLTSVTVAAVEGRSFNLSCIHATGLRITTALWYRNCVLIFQTNGRSQMNKILSRTSGFRAVSERISVTSDLTQHSVFLAINATLDEGSVWTCGNGQRFSNSITVKVMEYVTDESSSSATSTDSGTRSHHTTDGYETGRETSTANMKDEKLSDEVYLLIFAIAGSAGGLILVLGLITVCIVVSRRTSDVYAGIRDKQQVSCDSQQQPTCLVLTNVMLQGNNNPEFSDKKD